MKSTETKLYSFKACLKNKLKGRTKQYLHHLNRRLARQLAKEIPNEG